MRHNSASSPHDHSNPLLPSLRCQAAHRALNAAGVWSAIQESGGVDPRLVGTIPLGVDLPESDLDIICEIPSALCIDQFEAGLSRRCAGFTTAESPLKIWQRPGAGDRPAVVAHFEIPTAPGESNKTERLIVEIFADAVPVEEQMAYRHYLNERTLLLYARNEGRLDAARTEIRRLKQAGKSTEAAFCEYFAIPIPAEQDEYRALYDWSPERGT